MILPKLPTMELEDLFKESNFSSEDTQESINDLIYNISDTYFEKKKISSVGNETNIPSQKHYTVTSIACKMPEKFEKSFLSEASTLDQLVGKMVIRTRPIARWMYHINDVSLDRSFINKGYTVESVNLENKSAVLTQKNLDGSISRVTVDSDYWDGNWREISDDFPKHNDIGLKEYRDLTSVQRPMNLMFRW